MTRTPATARALIDLLRSPNTARAAALLGGIVAATLPVTAEGQTLSNNNSVLSVAGPITLTVPPNLQIANPTLTINPTTLTPLQPGSIRNLPTLSPSLNPAIRPSGITPSINAAGLGQLVAPGRQDAGVVVGRIGSTAGTTIPNLTVDFEGDGLINFEIAPGIVDIPAETASADGKALGGLVGQHVTMATGTADRVLDSVINLDGVNPATSFEVANGTVVLGGYEPRDIVGAIEIPIPDDTGSRDPTGAGRPDPDSQSGQRGDDPVTGGGLEIDPRQTVEICLSHGCYTPGTTEPKPETEPDLGDIFNFSGLNRLPTVESAEDVGMDDLLNVSIMLPLRGREQEADQFSNYGNEEIW